MRRRSVVAGLSAAVTVAALAMTPGAASAHDSGHGRPDYKKVGYFIQWGIYDRQYFVKNLVTSGQAARLTHINYAFGNVDASGKCASGDPWADYQRPVSAEESVDGVADVAGVRTTWIADPWDNVFILVEKVRRPDRPYYRQFP